ncbi:MAG TPA: hypothetical protein VLL31_00300, partial [Sulfurovum sp.]|nr:hypothetical protein [Sulfurovum sp.]
MLLLSVFITLSGCGGGGGGTGDTVTPEVNTTETNTSILPLVIIRIEFNDYQFSSPASVWNQKIFGKSEGQLNDYFNEISYGKFQFETAKETDGV